MKKSLSVFLFIAIAPVFTWADNADQKLRNVAKPTTPQAQPQMQLPTKKPLINVTIEQLQQQPALTQQLLSDAIFARQAKAIEMLLPIYQQFPNADLTLVAFAQAKLAGLKGKHREAIRLYRNILAKQPDLNVVRIELAMALFNDQQNNAAEDQFNKAKSVENLPVPVAQLIEAYLSALQKRNRWNIGASAYYLHDNNVNGTSKSPNIENTGYVKSADMLPQKAQGFAYNIDLSRDFNLFGSHYLAFQNDFYGKTYWDSHDNDEMSNRTLLGYAYKTEKSTFRLFPFFGQRWSAGTRQRHSIGGRAELNYWLSPRWQISTALEYSKQKYRRNFAQNGSNKLASATLLWVRKPTQYFTFGVDASYEQKTIRQFSSDTHSLRLGWGQEWQFAGLSSRLNVSLIQRHYKDIAKLGGYLNLGKIRKDKVYSASLTLWKRDWHLFGITPKLQLSWRKHDSNLPTLYSYTDKNANIIFEKRF